MLCASREWESLLKAWEELAGGGNLEPLSSQVRGYWELTFVLTLISLKFKGFHFFHSFDERGAQKVWFIFWSNTCIPSALCYKKYPL